MTSGITENEKPMLIYQKRADGNGRVVIPKIVLDNLGHDFYFEIYKDKIIIKPIREEN